MKSLATSLLQESRGDPLGQGDEVLAFSVLRRAGDLGETPWLPLALILGAIGAVAYADHRVVSISLIYLYILPLSLAAIFLRREISYALIVVCILIHYIDSPRRIGLGLRLFHDLSALLCFAFVVYVIQRYVAQREALAQAVARQRDELLKDLKLAGQVQRLFLPSAKPAARDLDIAGIMQPARWLSGDYYTYVPTEPQKLEVAIADVAGKGVPASLLMSATAASMRLECGRERNLLEIVGRLNEEIQSVSDGERYVTLVLAEIDTRLRKLRYINCGHNPVLWFRSRTKTITSLGASCPPIGLIETKICELSSESLENGDLLVLYTDGVTEAMDASEEEFGVKRLSAIVERGFTLGAEQLASHIVDEALRFTAGQGFQDDVTVVVVKCQFFDTEAEHVHSCLELEA